VASCVVFGANGFLGSHLVDELVARGHDVTAFDRFSSDNDSFTAPDVRHVAGDFMNRSDVARALRDQDYVFHFVSTTTPASAENDPTLDARTNIVSSIDLFSLAADAGARKLYFASTGGAIYGDRSGERLSETTLPEPLSPYAIGKLAIEGYLHYFARKRGLESVALRISNPYGPRQRATKVQGVIPIFLRRLHAGLPLHVLGDGSMVRDYIFATDAAAMIADTVGLPTAFDVYNIGSGAGTSVADLLGIIAEVTGLQPEVDHAPQPSTFVHSSVLDVSRFSTEFGSRALVGLREGIAATWHSIRSQTPQI
jgi:UDP-glucose 4-epimerase